MAAHEYLKVSWGSVFHIETKEVSQQLPIALIQNIVSPGTVLHDVLAG